MLLYFTKGVFMQKIVRNQDLRYQGIYLDKHNRYVHFNKRKNTGTVIPETDLRKWQLYKSRYLIPILAGYLGNQILYLSIPIAIAFGIVLLVIMEISYRRLVASYIVIDDFQPEDLLDYKKELAEQDRWKVIFRTVLFFVLGILLIVSIFTSGNELVSLETAVFVAVTLFCFYNSIVGLTVLLKAPKE